MLPSWLLALLALGLLSYFSLAVPDPLSYIASPDTGNQTAGGQQIAFGEAPFIAWRSTYGPLRFYLSFIAQVVGGGRVGAELVLCTVANTLTYLLLLICTYRICQKVPLTTIVVTAAILLMPPFTKFYIALCPLLALTQAYRYAEVPTTGRLACMAGAIVFALAYRWDVALWSILPCIVAICLGKTNIRRLLCLLLFYVLAIFSPWLIYLLLHGALWEYIIESTYYGVDLAKGLELPYPSLKDAHSWFAVSNLPALSYMAIYPAFLFIAVLLLTRRRELERSTRRYFYIALPLAGAALLQTMHRSDYAHLRQGITGLFLLLALVIWMAWRDSVGGSSRIDQWQLKAITKLVTVLGLIAISLPIAWGASCGQLQLPVLQRVSDWTHLYNKQLDGFLVQAHQQFPKDIDLEVMTKLRQIIPPGGTFFAAPYLTNLYTMTGRRFASGQLFLAPGYFNDIDGQSRMVRRLIDQKCPPVVELTDAKYDGLPSRSSRAIAPQLFDFVESHYHLQPSGTLPSPYRIWLSDRSDSICGASDRTGAS